MWSDEDNYPKFTREMKAIKENKEYADDVPDIK